MTVDVLSKSLQPTVATHLGYPDRSPSKRLERFMRDLYTHSRNIYLITRTLAERLALLPKAKTLASIRNLIRSPFRQPAQQILDGFKMVDGQIHPGSNRVFRDQPRRMMRVFLHAQQRGLKLHPDTAQLIRNELALVDRAASRARLANISFGVAGAAVIGAAVLWFTGAPRVREARIAITPSAGTTTGLAVAVTF